jgi:hypothetical protein
MNDDNVTTYKGYKIKLTQDDSPENPRSWDCLGTFVSGHRREWHGDTTVGQRQHSKESHCEYQFDSWQEVHDLIKQEQAISLPVYIYSHSGETVSTSNNHYPFTDPWDAGRLGLIFVTADKIRAEFKVKRISKQVRAKVAKILESEIETYNQWLTGDVWGYEIFGPDCEDLESADSIDSCWGYYRSEFALEQAKAGVDLIIEANQAVAWGKFEQVELSGVISD